MNFLDHIKNFNSFVIASVLMVFFITKPAYSSYGSYNINSTYPSSSVYSQIPSYNNHKLSNSQNSNKVFSFSIETGFRMDNLDWDMNEENNNLKNNASWKNIKIFDTKVSTEIPFRIFDGNLFLSGSVARGSTFGGDSRLSTYSNYGTENEVETDRRDMNSSSGGTKDYAISLKYKLSSSNIHLLPNKNDNYIVIPMFGYAISEQNLRVNKGVQKIDVANPSNEGSTVYGLNSSYDATWKSYFFWPNSWGVSCKQA